VNKPRESRPHQPEYARLSVALMSGGVVVVSVGLATGALGMHVAERNAVAAVVKHVA